MLSALKLKKTESMLSFFR